MLVSEDLDELLALSDRIVVLYHGRMAGIVPATMPTGRHRRADDRRVRMTREQAKARPSAAETRLDAVNGPLAAVLVADA